MVPFSAPRLKGLFEGLDLDSRLRFRIGRRSRGWLGCFGLGSLKHLLYFPALMLSTAELGHSTCTCPRTNIHRHMRTHARTHKQRTLTRKHVITNACPSHNVNMHTEVLGNAHVSVCWDFYRNLNIMYIWCTVSISVISCEQQLRMYYKFIIPFSLVFNKQKLKNFMSASSSDASVL